MSAEPVQAGLSRAQRAIADTYDELCRTLDNVNELTAEGAPDIALRLVDLQRDALNDLVARVAEDVAVIPIRRRTHRVRTAVGAVLAAAAAVAGLVLSRGGEPGLDQELARAERIADPAARFAAIEAVYREAVTRPSDAGTGFSDRVAAAASRIADDAKNCQRCAYDSGNRDLVSRASQLAAQAGARDPETDPPPPPSQGASPVDEAQEGLRKI